jgi:hypothetical protein
VNPELTNAIFARFPLIFRNRNLPPPLGLPFGFDFYTGDACEGWFRILERVFARLEAVCQQQLNESVAEDALISVIEVFQKSGVLRIRLHPIGAKRDPEIFAAIEEAVEASKVTCLFCGAVGVLRMDTDWHRVSCSDCEAKCAKEGKF